MPKYSKTILCLANSRKNSGRCIAGKEISPNGFGPWIRPVSSRPDKELNAEDRQYDNPSAPEPALLDVIGLDFLSKDPHPYQTENHLIDHNYYWDLSRRASFQEAVQAVDPAQANLWGLTTDSSYHGMYDRIDVTTANSFNYSLRLIRVSDFKIRVSQEQLSFGNTKRHVRGYFTYSGNRYAWAVTDPLFPIPYLAQTDNTYSIGDALLCLSLGEPSPHQPNYCYKLIAGVILP